MGRVSAFPAQAHRQRGPWDALPARGSEPDQLACIFCLAKPVPPVLSYHHPGMGAGGCSPRRLGLLRDGRRHPRAVPGQSFSSPHLLPLGHRGGLPHRQAGESGSRLPRVPASLGWRVPPSFAPPRSQQYCSKGQSQGSAGAGSLRGPALPTGLQAGAGVGIREAAVPVPEVPEWGGMDGAGAVGVSPSFLGREEAHAGSTRKAFPPDAL